MNFIKKSFWILFICLFFLPINQLHASYTKKGIDIVAVMTATTAAALAAHRINAFQKKVELETPLNNTAKINMYLAKKLDEMGAYKDINIPLTAR